MDQPIITKTDVEQKDRQSARWTLIGCSVLVFITSVCIMVLELTASRLIAKAVGSSLYTWTSVIGVILAGISIGNFLGGWVADRYNHRRALAWLFFVSSFCCMTIYPLSQLVSTSGRPDWISWQVWVVIIVSSLFLHPSVVLGMISPITASMALAKAKHTGSTVGNVYAWGAMGSIFGTFLAGFYLISLFGTQHIIWMTAATLALMGVIVASGQQMFRGAMLFGWLQLVFWIGLIASVKQPNVQAEEDPWWHDIVGQAHELGLKLKLRGDDAGEYNDESDYFYINVANRHERGDTVKALHLDHLTHSYFNPQKPTELYYDYEEVYAAVTERSAESWNRETIVKIPKLAADAPVFPAGTSYDPVTNQLKVRGAINEEKRATLLALSPSGAYWKAVSELTSQQNMFEMSGLSTMPLEKLPPGLTIPEDLAKKVRFDETLGTLIRYDTVTADEREKLLNLPQDRGYRDAVEDLFKQSRQTSTLFIGGGGFVFPRWIEANFPKDPLIHVLELDPAVKLAVQREMGLPADDKTFVKTILGDARNSVDDLLNGLGRLPGTTAKHNYYDFVYGDAFNDFSVPWHLTTQEFAEKIKALMTPDEGVFLVNIIDIYPRAESPVQTARGKAEVSQVRGPLPAEIWSVKNVKDKWYKVPDQEKFGKIDIQQEPNGNYKMRCNEELSSDSYEAWTELFDEVPPVEIASEDGKASPVTPAVPNTLSLVAAIDELSDKSNVLPVYSGELPASVVPVDIEEDRWTVALAPYDYLEIKVREPASGEGLPVVTTGESVDGIKMPTAKTASYVLGLRGVMSRDKEQELLKLAGDNKELQTVFRDLSRQSRDAKPGRFLGAYVNTVQKVFPNVYVFSANEGLPSDSRDTFVVACSLKKIDFTNLEDSGGFWNTAPFASMESKSETERVYTTQMTSILELARGMTLTDDFAPVDNLLIPVFAEQ